MENFVIEDIRYKIWGGDWILDFMYDIKIVYVVIITNILGYGFFLI